ncbi:hypothetical protein [Kineococcus sp. SYSU DK018]|uniref:hypothetical protein n=1 Tax=Kineococcus sp. SYSU DK018 TaxID=3383139 RepID=UPI003D7F139C
MFVDDRAFPMLTLLPAYGLTVIARRQEQRGAPWPRTRSLLLRERERTLVVAGALALLPCPAFNGVPGPRPARPCRWSRWSSPAPRCCGVLLARRRVLQLPAEHLPLLRRLAPGGSVLGVAGVGTEAGAGCRPALGRWGEPWGRVR